MVGSIAAIVCILCVLTRIFFVWTLKQKKTLYDTERANFQMAKGEADMKAERLKQVKAEKKQLTARQDLVQKDLARLEELQEKAMAREAAEQEKMERQKKLLDKQQKY